MGQWHIYANIMALILYENKQSYTGQNENEFG